MRKAMQGWGGRLAAVAVAGAAGMASAPAAALVTLDTSLSNIACGITDAAGHIDPGDCTRLSFAALIEPGETAFLRATLNYHYTDDGLPLPTPMQFQVNSLGMNGVVTFHEAAALYVNSNLCDSRYCSLPPHVRAEGTMFAPLILGLNDHPDDLRGSRDMYIEMTSLGDLPLPMSYSTTLVLLPFSIVYAAPTAPVPEPATVGLFAACLIALGWRLRRRRSG
jgi:PEP-CTERM motif